MSDIWECSAREFLPGGAIETAAEDEVAAAEAEVDLLKICAEASVASNCFSLSGGLFS